MEEVNQNQPVQEPSSNLPLGAPPGAAPAGGVTWQPPQKKSVGPLIGIIIIVVVLIIGGLYFWGKARYDYIIGDNSDEMMMKANDGDVMMAEEGSEMPPMSESDSLEAVEQDLGSTAIDAAESFSTEI